MVHRAIFGSIERFFGVLTESTAGDFPFWLSPVQLRLLPVSDDFRPTRGGVKGGRRRVYVRRLMWVGGRWASSQSLQPAEGTCNAVIAQQSGTALIPLADHSPAVPLPTHRWRCTVIGKEEVEARASLTSRKAGISVESLKAIGLVVPLWI